ncbi:putative PMR5 domain, PC-Esterase [Lupinus albus]|uniref:Putative PMR5 domain, PC-Esterase n=1 Tax=Lupinus albus TaxID=3870 RepID=A0A6A4QGZ2_LUPAL|nr:putative PMR5 domain, PC-Esterase [Lupinus albus]
MLYTKMGTTTTTNASKDQPFSLIKILLPWTPIALLPIAILSIYFYPLSFMSPEGDKVYDYSCDYSDGKWVQDKRGPLYNESTSSKIKIKKSQNCIANGRPDSDYLYWKWKPSQCNLPRFEPQTFLQLIKNKHVAFVGDSLARNQIESLLCMLATASTPKRVKHQGSRRWHFASYNANVSFYWSSFLVQGIQRSESPKKGPKYNTMYLDHVNERWARDIDEMDLVVISFGHWFLVPSVYYEADSVIGCLNCTGLNNYNEIDFYGPLRKALRTSLNSIIERKAAKGNRIDVIVETISPSHFEGDWDKGGTCSKSSPYREGEKQLEGTDAEIRMIELEEVENAKEYGKQYGGFRLEALDVTKLALLRPDGHPGAYMNPFPFANGVQENVQNDCVHWCLPGPIDTWNEILLEMMKKWEEKPRSEE